MDKIIKNCSIKIEEKDKEIEKLKEKEIFLNKKIKSLEKTNYVNISNTIYNNNNKSEAFSIMNSNNKISGENQKKYPIKIIKRNKNDSHELSSFNNNIIIRKKNNHSSTAISTINLNKSETNVNIFKKNIRINNNNKNNTMDENIKICLKKNARSKINSNSRNNFRKNSYIKMAKVSTNITNNNYNVQKNNVLINLNSMNMEKKIIQQKLQKYLKIINTKINNLKNRLIELIRLKIQKEKVKN